MIPNLRLPAATLLASLALGSVSSAAMMVLDLSSGSATEDGVTVTLSGNTSTFNIETVANPNLITVIGGDTTVERISADGAESWTISIASPGFDRMLLLLRDVDTNLGVTESWTISSPGGISSVMYLGTADDDDPGALNTSFGSYNSMTGVFTGSANGESDPYSVLDVTGLSTFTISASGAGTQWALYVGNAVPEPGVAVSLAVFACLAISRRRR